MHGKVVSVLESTFSMPYHVLIWSNTFMSRLIRGALRANLGERIGVEVGISHELWTTTTTEPFKRTLGSQSSLW